MIAIADSQADQRRRYKRDWERRRHANETDIDSISAIANPARRAICLESLHLFLQWYFPDSTGLTPFSDDHVHMIDRLEKCLTHGGRDINAVYRGFSKTTITENAAIWATLKGIRRFVAIYAADQGAANSMVESIIKELCENDRLAADFPEICELFAALEGKPQRCRAQTFQGRPTHIRMAAEYLVFPTIYLPDGNGGAFIPPACGAIIKAKGLTSASRGMSMKRPDGAKVRPDFALIDDFQTDESAKQPGQVNTRLNIIRKAILKSAGHRKSIACAINATVIEQNDAVDQLLDPEKNPAWDGMRVKMVRQWSKAHETLWQDYRRIRHTFNRDIQGDKQRAETEATEFYRQHQPEMDEGCVVSWVSCFDPENELSAIQHAYNLYLDDPPEVFASECQNDPVRTESSVVEMLTTNEIIAKTNGYPRGIVPDDVVHLTGFCDVHGDVLYWMVCGYRPDFTGYVIDYGTFPDQPQHYFTKSQATRTLKRWKQGAGTEAAIIAGLESIVGRIVNRDWYRQDRSAVRIGKFHIDKGFKPDEIETVCRKSDFSAILQPQQGMTPGPHAKPISEYDRKKAWRIGDNWYEPKSARRALRYIGADVNYWKGFFHNRLNAPLGTPGCLSLYQPDRSGRDHRMLADHFTSEQPQETIGKRTVIQWKNLPNRDNHWLDCAVGCMIAASTLGVQLEGLETGRKSVRSSRPQVRLSDLRKRGNR